MASMSKLGFERINKLENSFMVEPYHKTLLKGIKDRAAKRNLSKSDIDIFQTINKKYPFL